MEENKENVEKTLIIIGGAEDKKGEKTILKEVVRRLNKTKGKLVIATIATELPRSVGAEYKTIFHSLGVEDISILNIQEREDSYEDANIMVMKEAAMIFFTGGDQLKITSLLGGSPMYEALKEAYERGCAFVGTSAGASVMSETMIVGGEDEESPKKCTITMAPGLGLIKSVIIDQHFAQRGRIGRLLSGVAENPESLGIGIDEDTAIEVNGEGIFKVLGSSGVYVIDGSNISHTNVSEQYPEEVLSIFNVRMHVLKCGDKFDLNSRQPLKEDK